MRADVPPDVRVVRDAAGLLELADHLRVLGVVGEAGRHARARERREDHLPRRREPGLLAAPEGRVGREREQVGEVREHPVQDDDRLLRPVDGDVHVHAEDQLATGDVLELVDERAVAVARGDPLPLEQAERVRAGRADPELLPPGHLGHVGAQPPQLAVHVRRRVADGRGDLEHGLHELRRDALDELLLVDPREHRVDVLHEVERLRVEEHVLLLDAQREGVALAVAVLEDAAAGGEALARDRCGVELFRHAATVPLSGPETRSLRP